MFALRTIFFIVLFVFFPVINAHAYLDPGTGSIILQAVIAVIAMGLVTIKAWWYRVASFFKGGNSEDNEPEDNE